MAILRLSTGQVYTTIEDISSRIGSTRVGTFAYPESFRSAVAKLPVPLTKEGVDLLTSKLDPAAVALPAKEGLTHRRLGCIIPPTGGRSEFIFAFGASEKDATPAQMTPEQLSAYTTPHRVLANDWHFVMRGGIIKGLQLAGGQQAVLYVQPGEWIRLNPQVVNWPIFPVGEPTIGISFFDQEWGTFGQETHADVKVRPEMLF
jgi:hypothetical protein